MPQDTKPDSSTSLGRPRPLLTPKASGLSSAATTWQVRNSGGQHPTGPVELVATGAREPGAARAPGTSRVVQFCLPTTGGGAAPANRQGQLGHSADSRPVFSISADTDTVSMSFRSRIRGFRRHRGAPHEPSPAHLSRCSRSMPDVAITFGRCRRRPDRIRAWTTSWGPLSSDSVAATAVARRSGIQWAAMTGPVWRLRVLWSLSRHQEELQVRWRASSARHTPMSVSSRMLRCRTLSRLWCGKFGAARQRSSAGNGRDLRSRRLATDSDDMP